jgi:HEAT repeat protein
VAVSRDQRQLPDWLDLLTQGDATQRSRALDIVRSLGADAIPVLLAALDDRESRRVWDALEVLGAPAAAAVLERFRERGQPLSRGEATLLARSDNGWDALLGAMEANEPVVREAAAVGLGSSARPEAASHARSLLADADPGVRYEAASALGKLRDTASIDALSVLVADEDEEVRAAAGWALAQLGTEDALVAATVFLQDPSVAVRVAMIDNLAATGAIPTDTLIRLLRGADPGVGTGSEIHAVLDAMGASPDPDAEPALLELLSAPHARWRAHPNGSAYGDHAADVLDRLGTPTAAAAATAWRSLTPGGPRPPDELPR